MLLADRILDLAQGALVIVVLWWGLGIVAWSQALRTDRRRTATTRWAGRLARLAPPGSRRLANATLAVSLLGAGACTTPGPTPPRFAWVDDVPATTTPAPASSTTATTLPPSTTLPPTTLPPTTLPPETAPPETTPPESTPPPTAAPEAAAPNRHVVVPGDHLWAIAAAHLATGSATPPSDAEIAVHWRRLIALNLDTLRSGDPDLIHPGEVVTLPPLGESNGTPPG